MITKTFRFEYFIKSNSVDELFSIDVKLNNEKKIVLWLDSEQHNNKEIVFQIHTWYDKLDVPDLSKLSEEEMFQYSLLNLNYTVDGFDIDIYLVRSLQILIHNEYKNPKSEKIIEEYEYSGRKIKQHIRYMEVQCAEDSVKVLL